MRSDHVNPDRLYESVYERAFLEEDEIQHMRTCEQCQELARMMVRQMVARREDATSNLSR
jgi:hypothetical protein